MSEVTEVIEKTFGISKEEQKRIFEEVQENNRKLRSCDLHDFSVLISTTRYQCSKCKGIVNSRDKHWYEVGIQHAKEYNYEIE